MVGPMPFVQIPLLLVLGVRGDGLFCVLCHGLDLASFHAGLEIVRAQCLRFPLCSRHMIRQLRSKLDRDVFLLQPNPSIGGHVAADTRFEQPPRLCGPDSGMGLGGPKLRDFVHNTCQGCFALLFLKLANGKEAAKGR